MKKGKKKCVKRMKKAKVLPIHKGGRYNLKCDFCKEAFPKVQSVEQACYCCAWCKEI